MFVLFVRLAYVCRSRKNNNLSWSAPLPKSTCKNAIDIKMPIITTKVITCNGSPPQYNLYFNNEIWHSYLFFIRFTAKCWFDSFFLAFCPPHLPKLQTPTSPPDVRGNWRCSGQHQRRPHLQLSPPGRRRVPGHARGRSLHQFKGLPHQEVGLEQQTAATGASLFF